MKTKYMYSAFVLFLFCAGCLMGPQIQSERLNDIKAKEEKMGIPITQTEFDRLIEELLERTKDFDRVKDTSFYIQFVRVVNTIDKRKLFEKYADLKIIYYDKIFKDALVVLDASFYKGGAFYCYKHNLFMGGPPDSNSQFRIIP